LVAIDSRVFFRSTPERLQRLRDAKKYRNQEQVILHIDTRLLVDRYEGRIELCRFNSGAITQRNHPLRSRQPRVPINRYPDADHRRKYGRAGALAEVTVLGAVPDVIEMTVEVEHLHPLPGRRTCSPAHVMSAASHRDRPF
jgi:hypothetical protein